MSYKIGIIFTILILLLIGFASFKVYADKQDKGERMKFNKLTPEEEGIIVNKGTEAPFSGKYYKHNDDGTYSCKQCGTSLYESGDKFDSECGWPSFDDAIPGTVKQQPDTDGSRTEIVCANCGGHLGHVFFGEGLTNKNTRFCVNSLSLGFEPMDKKSDKSTTAYFAGGCFWGTEHHFKIAKGVISTTVGYMGGDNNDPSYKQVCSGTTGHAEAMEVIFDPAVTDFETLARLFFEIHDPTEVNRQGPDIGTQYRSVIFYNNDEQKSISEKLIKILKDKGYDVATQLVKADKFWEAEDYHQDYYSKTGKTPYCHVYQKRF